MGDERGLEPRLVPTTTKTLTCNRVGELAILVSSQNPTDDVSQEVKASEDLLFFKEPAFMRVLYILLGIVGFMLLVGMSWEFLWNRPKRRK